MNVEHIIKKYKEKEEFVQETGSYNPYDKNRCMGYMEAVRDMAMLLSAEDRQKLMREFTGRFDVRF
ncbi:hypothetical protein [Clostridium beijerinckii]|jgi:hypothetical protein|uniref:hypothetical protein n=1 Tax=Clostridium beijerinckii TaxID=1520 RepID=UPI00156FAF2C|nr:hypothetical protein [Clostridium beijerinckii]NRU52461.1 hypothetical protein [Clostridium beijerinckii]NYC69094.1 hypothetical protein [Clostridium beijerinckii]